MNQSKHRILVLGGTGYIGSALCRLLIEEANLAFTYHSNAIKAQSLAQELSVHSFFACDLRNPNQIHDVIQQAAISLDGLSALIVATGISGDQKFYSGYRKDSRLELIQPQELEEILKINLQGPLIACQAAAPFLKAAGKSNIVILGSMDGLKAVPSPIHFASSKSALKGLVESLSKELGPQKTCVNLIAPGILAGGASNQLSPDFKEPYLKHCALKRLGTAEEVAEVAAWLALENTYMTGQSILLDGGL